ncbi:hypothetical protein EG68_02914 [Paragonimus skrjabini miyazakii]|uniref:Uncharacterized protein n=1 Tax=Paragonimus skrjabini miyazakii TaxID=59628 RepID=A0A8S9Z1I8_9TREM|nr:hypothetical protein EG68_02914 [Paragonimus skrjabini miyazakii]
MYLFAYFFWFQSLQAEKCFVDRQLERRAGQAECFRLEEARNRVNSQLDTINRSDEMFLKLITEVHELWYSSIGVGLLLQLIVCSTNIHSACARTTLVLLQLTHRTASFLPLFLSIQLSRKHKEARTRLATIETAEQVAFDHFSAALRRSQAEERLQANRMRQWSIGLSVAAGLVGFGTTWLRYHKQPPVPSGDSGAELYASENIVKASVPKVQQKIRNVDLRGVYLAYDKLTGLDRVRLVHDEVVQLLVPTVTALQHTTEQLQKLIDPTISTLQNATEQLQKFQILVQSSERPVFQTPPDLGDWFPPLLAIGVMIGIGWLLFGRS